MKKAINLLVILAFLLNPLVISLSNAQVEAVAVMTLPDGTVVSMTSAQLSALAAQPGITIAAAPVVGATQVAIPVPAALGGGYIVGTPAAIASGLGTAGIATGVTASAVVGATVAAGTITAGGLAGVVATLGVAGTVAAGAAMAAGVVGGVVAATGGEGEGAAPAHHVPAHY